MAILTRETRIYLAIWRRAVANQIPEKLEFPTIADCISFSRNMYRAIKPFRDMKQHDETLVEAIEKWAVWHPKSFEPGERPYCIIRPRAGLEMADNLVDRFKITQDELMTPAEKLAMQSAAKVADDLSDFLQADEADQPVSPRDSTPFYSRD